MGTLNVYLIRHEEAEEGDVDANRALTARGRRRMRATSQFLAEQPDFRVDTIWTSPLVRAVQTAEILAQTTGVDGPVIVRPEIASPPTLRTLTRLIEEAPAGTSHLALVGHEPTLSALGTSLIGGAHGIAGLGKGCFLALEHARPDGGWRFRWLLRPDGPRKVDDLSKA